MVGAQLGEEAIHTSLIAGAIGLIIVILFMILVYRLPGLVAGIALLVYTALMLVTLNAFDITLTLPGIAGIILSVSVWLWMRTLSFTPVSVRRLQPERVVNCHPDRFPQSSFRHRGRQHYDSDRSSGSGYQGYRKRQGIRLYPGYGYRAFHVQRSGDFQILTLAFYALFARDKKYYGEAKERKPIDFLGRRKICFIISIVLIVIGPVTMGIQSATGNGALNYSLEFKGGTSTNVTFNEDMSIVDIDSKVKPVVQRSNWRRRHSDSESNRNQSGHHQDQNSGSGREKLSE